MGQYWIFVNFTKKKYICPTYFGGGSKLGSILGGSTFSSAIAYLLTDQQSNGSGGGDISGQTKLMGSWIGHKISMIGDYNVKWDKQVYNEGKEFNNISQNLVNELNHNRIMNFKTCMLCFETHYSQKGVNDVSNNAYPIRGGPGTKNRTECCSKCNLERVIPKRLELASSNRRQLRDQGNKTSKKKTGLKKLRIKIKR